MLSIRSLAIIQLTFGLFTLRAASDVAAVVKMLSTRRHVIPKPTDVPICVCVPVRVTHYSSPSKLFLRYSNDDCVALAAPNNPHLYQVYIGMFCLVFEDKSQRLLRAKVTDVHKNAVGVQICADVFYVDWGDSDVVGLDCVFPITAQLASMPNMTVPCSLRKARPTRRSSCFDMQLVWPCNQGQFDAVFYGVSDAGVYDVDLFVRVPKVPPPNLQNVAQLLVQHGFAEYVRYLSVPAPTVAKPLTLNTNGESGFVHSESGSCTRPCAEAVSIFEHSPGALSSLAHAPHQKGSLIVRVERSAIEDFTKLEDDYCYPLNSYKVDMDDLAEATASLAVKDEHQICKFFTSEGYCRQREHCTYKYVTGEKDLMLLGAQEEVPKPTATFCLQTGGKVMAQVSYAVSPGNFCLIFPYGLRSIERLIKEGPCRSTETLESLMANLQAAYSGASSNEDRLQLLKSEGELVAARRKDDEQWCRARVVGVEGSFVRVVFVDFGDQEWVSLGLIKTLQKRFLRLPCQAVQACLAAHVEPRSCDPERTFTAEACAFFVECTAGKDLLAEVVGYDKRLMQVNLQFFESGRLHSVSSLLQSSRQVQFPKVCYQSSA